MSLAEQQVVGTVVTLSGHWKIRSWLHVIFRDRFWTWKLLGGVIIELRHGLKILILKRTWLQCDELAL